MNELCVPLPVFGENQAAEVEVTINGKKQKYHFRVESFKWSPEKIDEAYNASMAITEQKIRLLKDSIENYDAKWELIQIYTPAAGAKYIQVLFREK